MAGNKTPYYFPSRDADVVPWTKNFVTVLGALGMAYEARNMELACAVLPAPPVDDERDLFVDCSVMDRRN